MQALADEGLTVRQAAERLGEKWHTVWKFARTHGIPFAQEAPRLKLSRKRFEALWRDETLTVEQIAQVLGLPRRQTLGAVAREFGLPPRRHGPKVAFDVAEFTALWLAHVAAGDMAAHFGMGRNQVSIEARRLGLPARGRNWTKAISIDDFRVQRNVRRMAEVAAAETAAMNALKRMVA